MRLALLTIVLSGLGAGAVSAQTLVPRDPAAALADAAFASRDGYTAGEARLSGDRGDGRIDTLRVQVGEARASGGLPRNLPPGVDEADSLDVTLVRRWPRAISFSTDGLAFDVSPHAGLGVSSRGGQAEGGAMLTVSKSREDRAVEQLKDMGVRDGASFGDAGRWYLFAAASGRAVGLNMLRDAHGWDRAGWSTDPTGALVGDAQIGVGWRRGDMQSSFGVVHREVKGQHMIFGQQTRDDTVAAFTFSLRPGR